MLRFLIPVGAGQSAAARLLADRIGSHHPEASVTWLMCDPRPLDRPPASDGQEVLYAANEVAAGYRYIDVVLATSPEFARWALLPIIVERLLDEEPDQSVVVLSPSSQLSGPLDDLVTRSAGGALMLPRVYDAVSRVSSDGWLPDFAVLGPLARPMLAWWAERAVGLLRSNDLSESVRRDPWGRFISTAAGVVAAGDPRYRLSPWTMDELRVEVSADRAHVLIDGRPGTLAHFPDFDPTEPWWFPPPGADPLVFASDNEAVQVLCSRRASELFDAGWTSADGVGSSPLPGWSPGVAAVTSFRSALVAGEDPPNPYSEGQVGDFISWLTTAPEASETGVSLAADDLWARRGDLASAIPSVKWAGRPRLARWMWSHGLDEGEVNLALLPDPPRPRSGAGHSPPTLGVNLVGYHGSDAGLGVAVRRVAMALDAAGIPWQEVRYDRTASRQRGGSTAEALAPYYFHLVLTAPDQLPVLIGDLPSDFFADRYTIGLWYWETDVLTPGQIGALDHVDELWAATRYLGDIYRRYTAKPVVDVPIPLVFPNAPPRAEARQSLGLDDRFTFLFSFDFLSIPERKNPVGVIESFKRAFPRRDDVRLIIKTINGERFARERERLAYEFVGDRRIELWDRYMSGPDRLALVVAADCYVSLHRSEGLGLTMAEAMAAGTPVIATRYAGNLDFMDDTSALLVDAREVEIGPGHYYPAAGHWAEPDLDQAAAHMRSVRSDPALRGRLATVGRARIARFDAPGIGHIMSSRLVELWRVASVSGLSEVPAPL